jgi:hypothetical protein
MDTDTETTRRDSNGRFVPGQSGNPAGKKPGTLNRATVLRAALAEGEDIATARIVIDKALAGDAVAARFIVDRLTPRPRGRAIALDLPEGDMVAAFDRTIAAMAKGEITPDEALTVTRVLDGRVKALKAAARATLSHVNQKEPSPACGRGQGEGSGRSSVGGNSRAADSPHPNPLPQAGEGMRVGLGEGMRARAAADFRADLLHSTCILHHAALVPAALTTAARAA